MKLSLLQVGLVVIDVVENHPHVNESAQLK